MPFGQAHKGTLLLLAPGLFCLVTSGLGALGEDAEARGRRLVVERGCFGCHKYAGRGGTLGPDLTYVGDKPVEDFDFTRVEGERSVANWMFAYFQSPSSVVPRTVKPDLRLSHGDARALAAYLTSLKRGYGKGTVPFSLRENRDSPRVILLPPLSRPEDGMPPVGKTLYTMYCSACHGTDGQGGTVRLPEDSRAIDGPEELLAPALHNRDTLGVASDEYLRRIIRRGRSDTVMPAWVNEGGLPDDNIDLLVAHLRSWDEVAPPRERISASRGDARYGRMLYRSRCLGCHGRNGEGRIGLSLRSASFLALASDDFLAQAIVHGRANTAMPSWRYLAADEVSDLLAHIRTWEHAPADKQEVLHKLAQRRPGGESLRIGRLLYRSNCALCHGREGEGMLGSSLNKDAFLSIVDNEYLYTAIVDGRPGTAMPAWKHLSANDLAGLIGFLRTWNKNRRRGLEPYSSRGDRGRGRIVFQRTCARCHGRDAEGATGPQLGNPIFLASVTDAMLRQWIKHRCPRTQTRSSVEAEHEAAELSEAEVEDVVTHLRSLPNVAQVAIARRARGNVANGRGLYNFVCAECHGPSGEGVTASALSNPDFLRSASDGFLLASIVVGRDGTRMRPDITKILSAVEQGNARTALEDIVAFIRHWERHPPIAGIPARYVTGANVDAGEALYASHCAGCHGKRGNDGWAPTLNDREFLAAANDGFLQATLTRGRVGTAMRPFGVGADGIAELSAKEINHIVAFVRTWALPESQPAESR